MRITSTCFVVWKQSAHKSSVRGWPVRSSTLPFTHRTSKSSSSKCGTDTRTACPRTTFSTLPGRSRPRKSSNPLPPVCLLLPLFPRRKDEKYSPISASSSPLLSFQSFLSHSFFLAPLFFYPPPFGSSWNRMKPPWFFFSLHVLVYVLTMSFHSVPASITSLLYLDQASTAALPWFIFLAFNARYERELPCASNQSIDQLNSFAPLTVNNQPDMP